MDIALFIMSCLSCRTCLQFLVFMAVFTLPISHGFTEPRDVFAINSLYASMGFPPLAGWLPMGGDPCAMSWQGIECINSEITEINLNGANLRGRLSENLSFFSSLVQLDLSDNHIGGPIPFNLPVTLTKLYLYGNQFIGSIPVTISSLNLLTDLSVAKNQLEGTIPDSFLQLKSLNAMDLSGNNLTGVLPSSMGNLTSLNTLHLQDNQLSGTLDVLQDLPLRELNVENNLFSGPIPERMLTIPNFRKDGNPFNTSILPSPSVPFENPALPPDSQAVAPSPSILSPRKDKKVKTSYLWIAVIALLAVIVVLGMYFCLSWCCKKKQPVVSGKNGKTHQAFDNGSSKVIAKVDNSLRNTHQEGQKVGKAKQKVELSEAKKEKNGKSMAKQKVELSEAKKEKNGKSINALSEAKKKEKNGKSTNALSEKGDHKINVAESDRVGPCQLPAHSPLVSYQKYSIASLQQFTDSFSEENLVGKGIFGSVYKATLADGKLLAIKKLDPTVSVHRQTDQEFINLAYRLSKLEHRNVVKLVGHCLEHGQRLLVYEYCSNGSLYEALQAHNADDIHEKLTWNVRVNLALQSARALEYLHEMCQPPVVHKNFKSANILLDDDLFARVSDCGLTSSNSTAQELQACGYGAPELEMGNYTYKSDVYSFGVVMLELLTGRKSLDRSRPRAEQFLVRWAIPQLHDIDALSRMVDPSLNGAYSSKSISRFADIVSMCTQPEPEFRPPMSEIVQKLLSMVEKDS